MPWKECNRMDERLRFVARLLDGEHAVAEALVVVHQVEVVGAVLEVLPGPHTEGERLPKPVPRLSSAWSRPTRSSSTPAS